MRQVDRQFSWSDPTGDDPAPDPRRRRFTRRAHDARATCRGVGVRRPPWTAAAGRARHASFAATTTPCSCAPVTAACGSARSAPTERVKLPAALALGHRARRTCRRCCCRSTGRRTSAGRREISYRRHGDVGVLRFDFYNGAMSTGQCRRLTAALRHAAAAAHQGAGRSAAATCSPTASTSTSSTPRRRRRWRRGATSTPSTTCAGRSSPAPASSSSRRSAATPAPAA